MLIVVAVQHLLLVHRTNKNTIICLSGFDRIFFRVRHHAQSCSFNFTVTQGGNPSSAEVTFPDTIFPVL
ncbi:hypothetical protein CS542_05000 [Pedobacter sp. IW39]|nr:hypothetical protein CS542_05000 [Pedobacter sp. IW39]